MIKVIKKVISPLELKREMPMPKEAEAIKRQNDCLLQNVVSGKDKRLLIISGPCSADDPDAVIEYCRRLKVLNDRYADKMVIIPRIFTAKPRTNGEGYLGMMYQPYAEEVNINEGLLRARKMLIDCICETALPISDELLYPEYYDYFDDLISYYVIGARSSENPEHRNISSGLDVAVGVKNTTGGNLISLAGAVYACSTPKTFLFKGNEVATSGNKLAHAILRGYVDQSGVFFRNYSTGSISNYKLLCNKYNVGNKRIIVDCSHANSSKQIMKQLEAAREVISARDPDVFGLMFESYLFEGSDPSGRYGVSRTDACIGWEDTERIIDEIFSMII